MDFDIGKTIKDFRVRAGMSQGDISKRTNLQRFNLSRIENGHTMPDIDTLVRIGQAIDVPAWEILKEAEERLGLHEQHRL